MTFLYSFSTCKPFVTVQLCLLNFSPKTVAEVIRLMQYSHGVMRNFSNIKKSILRTIHRQRLFKGGDRIAVGVSGGKDSNFLLYFLANHKDSFRQPYDLAAFRVLDPQSPCYQKSRVQEFSQWCQALSVPLHLINLPALDRTNTKTTCFQCAWRRREALFKESARAGYPILALGHTAFDLAVTALMNLCLHGKLETMPPQMTFFQGAIRLIRPLCNVSESEIIRLSRKLKVPAPETSCIDSIGRTRHEMENHLRQIIREKPGILKNIIKGSSVWVDPINETI